MKKLFARLMMTAVMLFAASMVEAQRMGGVTLMWYWVMVMPKTARMYILMDRCFRGLIHIPFR